MPAALPGGALKPQLTYISPCSVPVLSWAQGRPSGVGRRAHEPERAPGWWERAPRWGGLRWPRHHLWAGAPEPAFHHRRAGW